ncbi:MlaD family protein [Marinicella litoralis]|uniref:Virulence factor Mce-like protein n=1 Tax=Marinicella litoralis TaxID=644220 RepID=A0A4R6XWB3_9GAMM|nr:MlaD family protein [Marinicella litoralis]TDR20778.1 virulence factor Mce-like protein [Marinicella litoralis]
MKRHISNYFWVGLFTLTISILTLWLLIKMTGKESDAVEYNSYYHNVTGLGYGTPVFFEGYRIGQIESIKPEFKQTKLDFKVTYSVLKEWKIPTDSKAQINSAGLLADMSINIKGGEAKDFFSENDTIPGLPPADLFAQLGGVSDNITDITEEKIKPMLDMLYDRLDSITLQIDNGLPEIMNNINNSTAQLDQLMNSANQVLSDENTKNLEAFVANLAKLSNQMQLSVKALDDGLENINGLVTDARGLISSDDSDMAQLLKTASKSMLSLSNKLDSISNEIESASMNLNEATNLIRKNPSSLIFSSNPEIADDDL